VASDPKEVRELGLAAAKRALRARDPVRRNLLTELAKNYLKRSVELERRLALMAWPHRSDSRIDASLHLRVDAPPETDRSGVELLANANRLVAEGERIVDGWRDLIERRAQEGQDTTIARDLLRTLNQTLEEHRRSRDGIKRTIAEWHYSAPQLGAWHFARWASMSSRRKGEITAAEIDRGWPHQVAIGADVVRSISTEIDVAKVELGAAPRGHSVFHGDTWYTVVCFADPVNAERFRLRFGGEAFDLSDRGRGTNWARWKRGPKASPPP
jgi:hypothetical protein